MTRDLGDSLSWMEEGTRVFLDVLDGLPDSALDAPTGLPSWTRRHVIAHVHYNAEALRRLVSWARTGERNPMYESTDHRNTEIEAGAPLPGPELRSLIHGSAEALAKDLRELPEDAWTHEIVTAQGRTAPATDIPWMRTREVWVHAVDLNAGVGFDDFPPGLTRALIDDIVTRRIATGQGPELTRWLAGRGDDVPDLGPWL